MPSSNFRSGKFRSLAKSIAGEELLWLEDKVLLSSNSGSIELPDGLYMEHR